MHEDDLIHSIIKGNVHAYEILIKQYQANVFRTAMGFVHCKEDAEEITQDVFIKIYQSLQSFKGTSAFSTWLYRITINTSLNYLRKKKSRNFVTGLQDILQLASKEKPADAIISEKSDLGIIKQAIDSLSQKQRLTFILAKYEELPNKKIALIMELSEGAVEQLLIRAKTNLKKILEKKLDWP